MPDITNIGDLMGGTTTLDTWLRWSILVIITVSGYMAQRSTRAEARRAAEEAQTAARLSAPTGNGFAAETKQALAAIRAQLDQNDQNARQELASVRSDLMAEIRPLRGDLTRHIADHAQAAMQRRNEP